MPVIPAIRRLRQGDYELKVSPGHPVKNIKSKTCVVVPEALFFLPHPAAGTWKAFGGHSLSSDKPHTLSTVSGWLWNMLCRVGQWLRGVQVSGEP